MTTTDTSSKEEVNFVFKIKKSEIQNLFRGNCNLNIKIQKEVTTYSRNLKTNNNSIETKNLTSRELEVLQGIAQGKTNEEIAKELIVSKNTIKAHVANILQKLKVEDRVQAVVKAIVEKIIEI